jgi:hypothetical protein
MSVSTEQVLQLAEALGISRADLGKAIGTVNVVARRQTAAVKVVVNEGEATKFGDITIAKQKPGTSAWLPKLGIFADQVPGLISELQAAAELLAE